MNRGMFITFEGPDGCGKTTIIKMIHEYLAESLGKTHVVLTREPGGTNNIIAEDIRNILLNKLEYKISPKAEALLFSASRAQHVNDFIKPNVDGGKVVLCDRYVHSSLVYQGIAREMGIDNIWKINEFAMDGTLPDITFLLMIKPKEGLKRIAVNKAREFNRLDRESIDLHKKVYLGYKKIAKLYPKNIITIDASQTVHKVFNDIKKILEKKL